MYRTPVGLLGFRTCGQLPKHIAQMGLGLRFVQAQTELSMQAVHASRRFGQAPCCKNAARGSSSELVLLEFVCESSWPYAA